MTTADTASPPARPTTAALTGEARRQRRRDLAVLVAVTIVLRLPRFFATRHVTFDDGVFGASAVAMRSGGVPFREVFSSQGPLFLPLVWLGDLVGLHTLNGPRVTAMASGIALVVVLYLAGREVSDRLGALVASGLAAVTGSSLAVTGSLAADGPAMALAAAAVLVALRHRRDPTTFRAALTGALLGAGICVKALVLPASIPIGLVLLFGRRPWHWLAAVGSAVAVGLVCSLPFGFQGVWDQSVVYHLDSPGQHDRVGNLLKVIDTLVTRDQLLLALGATALVGAVWHRRRGEPVRPAPEGDHPPAPGERRQPAIPLLLGLWAVAMCILLVAEHPLWRPHVSQMVPPLALLVATYRPSVRPMLVVTAVVLPLSLMGAWGALTPVAYRGDEARLVTRLQALPEGALAISDEPGQVWRSGHRTPDWLVDASVLRTDSDRPSIWITSDTVMDDAVRPEVCAVVAWTRRFGADMPDLEGRLADAGYHVAERYGPDRRLYVKADCRP